MRHGTLAERIRFFHVARNAFSAVGALLVKRMFPARDIRFIPHAVWRFHAGSETNNPKRFR
jgi:hypothetical protein